MFEDSLGVENQNEDDQNSSESNEKSSWWIGRWAHVIAILVFCLLYFPFKDRFWSWQLAITLSYIVFMLCYTCGLAFKDADDFFGNLQVPRYMATLLIRQVFVIALISLGAYLWFRLKVILPEWATREAGRRRLSLWFICGVTLACWAAVREATWMAEKIKRQFDENQDSA
jgi:hypothetical protein